MNDTPLTDAATAEYGGLQRVSADFARQLEMENIQLREQLRVAREEKNALLETIRATINDNLHLSDGDDCTLAELKHTLTKLASTGKEGRSEY